MEYLKRFLSFETNKELIYKECLKLNTTLEEAHLIYNYYEENRGLFMLTSNISFPIDKIVEIIILKLNSTSDFKNGKTRIINLN